MLVPRNLLFHERAVQSGRTPDPSVLVWRIEYIVLYTAPIREVEAEDSHLG